MILEAMPRGWVKPNHLWVRRVSTPDGKYHYTYYHREPLHPTGNTRELLKQQIDQALVKHWKTDVQLNRRGRSSIGLDDDNIVVVGAPNLLGRRFISNKSFVPPERRKNKPKPGQSCLGIIAGYVVDRKSQQRHVYVYPAETVESQLARETMQFHRLAERLASVQTWAHRAIKGRDVRAREIALVAWWLHDTHERIGGSGGQSVPKEILSELNRRKKEEGWTNDRYVAERESAKADTFGVLDIQKRHIKKNADGSYEVSYIGKAHMPHKYVVKPSGPFANQLALLYARATRPTSRIFSIGAGAVNDVYSRYGGGVTPHKERHAHAQYELKKLILNAWGIVESLSTKEALARLKTEFYQNISVPLGHANKSGTITTALNSYVGQELKNAYLGLVQEVKAREGKKQRRSIKSSAKPQKVVVAIHAPKLGRADALFAEAEEMSSPHRMPRMAGVDDWVDVMASLVLRAELIRGGHMSTDNSDKEVLFV